MIPRKTMRVAEIGQSRLSPSCVLLGRFVVGPHRGQIMVGRCAVGLLAPHLSRVEPERRQVVLLPAPLAVRVLTHELSIPHPAEVRQEIDRGAFTTRLGMTVLEGADDRKFPVTVIALDQLAMGKPAHGGIIMPAGEPRAGAGKTENKLSGGSNELLPDTGAPGAAVGRDPAMATLGTFDGTEVRRG